MFHATGQTMVTKSLESEPNPQADIGTIMTKSNGTGNCVEGICYGDEMPTCRKMQADGNCSCYGTPSMWKRGCPMNLKDVKVEDVRVRVGQQKQRKRK